MKIYSVETIKDFSEFYSVIDVQNKNGWTLVDALPSTEQSEGFVLIFTKDTDTFNIAS